MSATFKFDGEMFYGTNGAVEAYIEALATLATDRFGPDDPLAKFLRDERDAFTMGKLVFLDPWLKDLPVRKRFLELLDAATKQLLEEGIFTESGQQWVSSV